MTGFAFDDRGIYRPGETVHVKGWFRRVRASSQHRRSRHSPPAQTAHWSARDAFGNEFGNGDIALERGQRLRPEGRRAAGCGAGRRASSTVSVDDGGVGGSASVSFQIQEFRRPEFEVVTRAESAGPHLLTQPVTVAALAQYFSGGVLAGAPTVWQVTTSVHHVHAAELVAVHVRRESRPYWLRRLSAAGRTDGPGRSAAAGGDVGRTGACCSAAAGAESGDVHRPTDATGTTICNSTSTARSLISR